ncbi:MULTISPECIES: barstar family protein [Bacillus]|uniref:barstar family protein n=1 Tax=Bacillus TaxID=1386 RepID=UPI00035D19BC|nr:MULTISPECIES: barstar family protein [Bacillus]PGS03613.1 barnase inhibitor [Bacillus pseudomycoides]
MDNSRKEEILINVGNVSNEQELQKLLKEKLDSPNFYGENWNAFWDTITGLVELPETIVFKNWGEFERKLSEDANLLKNMLNKFNEKYPSLKSNIIYS